MIFKTKANIFVVKNMGFRIEMMFILGVHLLVARAFRFLWEWLACGSAMLFGSLFGTIRVSSLSKQGVGGRGAAASLSVTLDWGTKVCWHIAGRKNVMLLHDWAGNSARNESHDHMRRLRREWTAWLALVTSSQLTEASVVSFRKESWDDALGWQNDRLSVVCSRIHHVIMKQLSPPCEHSNQG